MARLLGNTIHQTYMAYDEIGLLAQSSEIVLDSVVNIIIIIIKKNWEGGGCLSYQEKHNIHFDLL